MMFKCNQRYGGCNCRRYLMDPREGSLCIFLRFGLHHVQSSEPITDTVVVTHDQDYSTVVDSVTWKVCRAAKRLVPRNYYVGKLGWSSRIVAGPMTCCVDGINMRTWLHETGSKPVAKGLIKWGVWRERGPQKQHYASAQGPLAKSCMPWASCCWSTCFPYHTWDLPLCLLLLAHESYTSSDLTHTKRNSWSSCLQDKHDLLTSPWS